MSFVQSAQVIYKATEDKMRSKDKGIAGIIATIIGGVVAVVIFYNLASTVVTASATAAEATSNSTLYPGVSSLFYLGPMVYAAAGLLLMVGLFMAFK